jgi:hypothetical protein
MHRQLPTHLVASYKEFKNNATECNEYALDARAETMLQNTARMSARAAADCVRAARCRRRGVEHIAATTSGTRFHA